MNGAQLPLWQNCETWQAVPQAPQCCGSLLRFTQVPLQLVKPAGQAQAPPWQVCPSLQALPQAPQFCGVPRLVHAPLQHPRPAAQTPNSALQRAFSRASPVMQPFRQITPKRPKSQSSSHAETASSVSWIHCVRAFWLQTAGGDPAAGLAEPALTKMRFDPVARPAAQSNDMPSPIAAVMPRTFHSSKRSMVVSFPRVYRAALTNWSS